MDPQISSLPIVVPSSAQMGLDISFFDRLIGSGLEVHVLDKQYRMHPTISCFPSWRFYRSMLMDGVSAEERVLPEDLFPIRNCRICFAQVACMIVLLTVACLPPAFEAPPHCARCIGSLTGTSTSTSTSMLGGLMRKLFHLSVSGVSRVFFYAGRVYAGRASKRKLEMLWVRDLPPHHHQKKVRDLRFFFTQPTSQTRCTQPTK